MTSLRARLEEQPSDELLEIWRRNDRAQWSDETFAAVRDILLSRGVDLPSQEQAQHSYESPRREVSLPSAFWLHTYLPLTGFGLVRGLLPLDRSLLLISIHVIFAIIIVAWAISGFRLVWTSAGSYKGPAVWKYLAIGFTTLWMLWAILQAAILIMVLLRMYGP